MNFRDRFLDRLRLLAQREAVEFPPASIPAGARPAAVLMVFWPGPGDGVELVLTRRTEHVSTHQGQVSFPGGRVDADETHQQAALREAQEELGIEPDRVIIMGRLDDAWSRYGHHVVPFVGWVEERPLLTPNPAEVAEVLIGDMAVILRPETAVQHEVEVGGVTHKTHAFRWEGGYVWGLSADLLLELVHWVRGEPSNRGRIRQRRMERFAL